MAKNKDFPYLKKFTQYRFQKVFNHILYSHHLSFGAKVYAFSLLTVPPQSSVNRKAIARKLGVFSQNICRWQNQLNKSNVRVRPLTPVSTSTP